MKKRLLCAAVLSTAGLVASGCSSSTGISADPSASGYGTIRISTGISDETEIIAHIYAQALQQAGYTTELVDTGTERPGYLTAMKAPEANTQQTPHANPSNDPSTVDIAPDYSGNLLLYLTEDGKYSPSIIEQQREAMASSSASSTYQHGWGNNDQAAGQEALPSTTPKNTPTTDDQQLTPPPAQNPTPSPTSTSLNANGLSSNDILNSINRVLPDGLKLLNAAEAQNRDALVVTRATAARYNLHSIENLAEHCGELTFGAPASFSERSHGLKALAGHYECTPKKFTAQDNQETLSRDLANNTVQVADIFSASALIEDNDYLVLDDPASIFIPQQIVPVARTDELPSSAQDAINTVSAKLTSEDLTSFNRLSGGNDAISPEDIATFWLEQTTE